MISMFILPTLDDEVLAFWRLQAHWQHAADEAIAAYFG